MAGVQSGRGGGKVVLPLGRSRETYSSSSACFYDRRHARIGAHVLRADEGDPPTMQARSEAGDRRVPPSPRRVQWPAFLISPQAASNCLGVEDDHRWLCSCDDGDQQGGLRAFCFQSKQTQRSSSRGSALSLNMFDSGWLILGETTTGDLCSPSCFTTIIDALSLSLLTARDVLRIS
jgi:hypothetical protein